MRSLPFLLNEAWANLRRHGLMTAAAVTTIAVSLALLGAFLLVFYQLQTATRHALDDFEMRVFCRLDVKKGDLKATEKRLRALPGVGSVTYLSREAAFREQARAFPIDLEGVPNRMNDTFIVKMADARRAADAAKTVRGWRDVVHSLDAPEKEMRAALNVAAFVRDAGIIGSVLLLAGALVVVSNTIRVSVFTRRREIKIMQLVGATAWFIRLPLVLEGLIHGLLGGALAGLCVLAGGRYAASQFTSTLPMLVSYGGSVDLPRCALALVFVGALVGATGALLSIRRYLHAV